MISFKPVVFAHQRRTDGTYNIKIRIYYGGQSKYLSTTLFCTQADLTRGMKLKNGEIINKANEVVQQMRAACSDINIFDLERNDVEWVVQHIRRRLRTDEFKLDFFEWADKYILTKRDTTRKVYVTALNAFERFLGSREMDINKITHAMVLDFVTAVDTEKKMFYDPRKKEWRQSKVEKNSKGASTIYVMKLAHVFNAAKDKFNDEDMSRIVIPRSPFDKVHKVFPPSNGQKNIGQEVMQMIIKAQTDDPVMRIALDAFVVSFGLFGANLADLYYAIPFKGDVWVYNRQKTKDRRSDKAEMHVYIPKEIRPFIGRLQQHRGPWWLPELHRLSDNKDICTKAINGRLKKWAEANGVPVFTFYAARHTTASLMRKSGVEKATIDEALCHIGDYEMADIYAERDWDLINRANEKVISLFDWGL